MIDKETMNKIIVRLDGIARNYEPSEYGLPLHSEGQRALMREAIREEIQKDENT